MSIHSLLQEAFERLDDTEVEAHERRHCEAVIRLESAIEDAYEILEKIEAELIGDGRMVIKSNVPPTRAIQ